MSYMALYRKFRPNSFEDVKGQDHIVTTLKNQMKANRIGHAYLFCGTRGTGKTSIAKILAKAVNCEHPVDGSPCNECETCRSIQAGASMNVIEIDAASNNGVDNIREIREEVTYRPTSGHYKVYIIDEVHMLSVGAFNALLKTLEEPPSYVIFILATTEAHKIPVTILSRCQRYDFKRITVDTISNRLSDLMKEEKIEVEDKAIRYIAKAADGSMRDALSLLDQCIAFYLGQVLTYDKVLEVLGAVDTEVFSELLRKVVDGNVTQSIHILENMVVQGKELGQFVLDFTWYLRNLLLVKTSENIEDVLDVSSETLERIQMEENLVDNDTLMRYIRILSDLSNQLRYATSKRVLVEVALIKLCQPQMEKNEETILDRLRVLERTLASVMEGGKIELPVTRKQEEQGESTSTVLQEEAPIIPEKMASEDMQRIKTEWRAIVGQTQGMLKSMLHSAVPKYNGNTGEDRLFVEFSNPLAQYYLDHPEGKLELEKIIRNRIGKNIEVQVVLKSSQDAKTQQLADISVEDVLKQNIQMDIIEEEKEDE